MCEACAANPSSQTFSRFFFYYLLAHINEVILSGWLMIVVGIFSAACFCVYDVLCLFLSLLYCVSPGTDMPNQRDASSVEIKYAN